MSNIKFIIHVGFPKAASTALQDSLASTMPQLKEIGVLYPESLRGDNSNKHEELFRLVRLNKIKHIIKAIKSELDLHSLTHTVILSTESIVNQLNNIEDFAWVELFSALKKLGSLELIVIQRDRESFLRSYYKQAVINQPSPSLTFYSTALPFEEFCELHEVKALANPAEIIKKLEVISSSPVLIFNYSKDVVQRIFSHITNAAIAPPPYKDSNISLKNEEVEFIRRLNALRLPTKKRNAWLRLLVSCNNLGSNTALILANRSSNEDILELDESLLSEIKPFLNPSSSPDDVKLKDLIQKAHNNLEKFKKTKMLTLKKQTATELRKNTLEKLENISTSKENHLYGKKLFLNKRLELAPFKDVPFSLWSNWEQDPLNNRSWQWRLNWLSFLSYLMAYHRSSGDDAVLSFAREAIQSWLDTYLNTDTSYPFEFIWHDHATALRAEQLVLFDYYCRMHAPEWAEQHAEFLKYLEHALVVHGHWLAKDSFYSEHTNHGLEQARVLLLLGTVFEGEHAREWQQIATRRIGSELAFSFTDEGVHVENSPAYHIFVFKVFLGIIKDYPDEVLGDLAEQFNQFSAKALSFITHILRPDGLLPPIGDTEQLPTSDAYRQAFGHRLEYQHFLYALTQGKQGAPSPVLNRVYTKSGYAIFRDQWPAKEHYQKAFHLIAKVGCSSRYHHQQDEGHISLYAGGEDWLIDSGLYNYINNDPVRKYMRGRPGHNVPMITHASYSKEFEHRLTAWQVTDYSEASTTPYLNMRLDVLQPVVHERQVDFNARTRVVKVKDKVSADDGQLRNITLQWHIPKDKTITIEGNQVVVAGPTGNQLWISFEGDTPDSLSVLKGRKEDQVFSCISYKANQVEPSQLLRVLFKERSALQVTTRFELELHDAYTAPLPSPHVTCPLDLLLQQWQQNGQARHSVMLGSHQAGLELARVHRATGSGHISLLVNDPQQCGAIREQFDNSSLSGWMNCRHLDLPFVTGPIAADKAALQGLEGIDLLVITAAGFEEKHFATVLLAMLPSLLKRMTKTGSVWVCNSLPAALQLLCETWAARHGFRITFVSGLA